MPGFFCRTLMGGILLCAAGAAQAGEGMERLHRFFAQTQKLRAEFEQTVTNAQSKPVQQGRGTVILQRPGKFRWDYRRPYEQLIVADGKKIWVYDKDLAQVTVKALDGAIGNSPAQLLSGRRDVEEDFIIRELGARGDELQWLELVPRDKDSGFDKVRLAFDTQDLRVMELVDNFGQTTRLKFLNIDHPPFIDPKAFQFIPPPGVDVIGE